MQLAHRRTARPFRGAARERSRGAVLVEATFITPIFLMLVFGIIEVGLAMNDSLALAHSVRAGTRVASASGNDLLADYGIIQSIKRESSALPEEQIIRIVVYRADKYGDPPSTSCQNGTPSSNTAAGAKPCNVYDPDDFDKVKSRWGCKPAEGLEVWCPTVRKVSQTGGGPEYVGVWMKIEHEWVTRMFGEVLTLTDSSVIQLEPRIAA
jgi:hypothetical protein